MTEPTYYGPTMVLNIIEYDADGDKDTDLFIVHDADDDMYYLYGHRGSRHSKNYAYSKSFNCMCALYDFINLTCNIKDAKSLTVQVNELDGLTSDSDYYDYKRKVSSRNEIVAYDNIDILGFNRFCKWMRAFVVNYNPVVSW